MKQCQCGHMIGSNAHVCPFCGKRYTGGVTWLVAIIFGLMLALAVYAALAQ